MNIDPDIVTWVAGGGLASTLAVLFAKLRKKKTMVLIIKSTDDKGKTWKRQFSYDTSDEG